MQLFSSVFFLGLLSWTLAKSVIVTYPQDTPNSVVEDAKQKLIDEVCSAIQYQTHV